MKQKTPMQELIERIQDRINEYKFEIYPTPKTEHAIQVLEHCKELAESLLEKEKEAITSAYNEGKYYKTNDIDRMWEDAEEYYNETFNTKEK